MTNSEAVSLLMNNQYYKQGYKQGISDVLDKIRAEIETLNPVNYVYMSSYDGHRGASDMKDDVLAIIDKCKEESEE